MYNKDEKIIDVTGIELTPGNHGDNCKGNGTYFDENGEPIECCCDECNYMMLCFPEYVTESWKKILKEHYPEFSD